MKKLMLLMSSLALASGVEAAGPLDADWKAVDQASGKQKARTAVERLVQLEAKAKDLKLWPDYAAAFLKRTQLEYGFTEESALKKEGQEGLVGKFAAQVETSPAEVRPMLRLALVHNYASLSRSERFWQQDRTKIAGEAATNQPPWSAERLKPSLQTLLQQMMTDAPVLQAEAPSKWSRLLNDADAFGDAAVPTLFDFTVQDFARLAGDYNLIDHDKDGQPTGFAADVLKAFDARLAFHASDAEKTALAYAKLSKANFVHAASEGPEKEKRAKRLKDLEALAEEFFETSWVSGLAAETEGGLRADDEACDLVQLHAYYLRFAEKWPKTPGGDACRRAVGCLEMPSLSVSTEQNWCRPACDIVFTYKNLTNVVFRMVALSTDDLAQHANFDHNPRTWEDFLRKDYFKRKSVREWSVDLPPQTDYRDHTYTIKAPADLPKGHYALFAAADGIFDIKKRNGQPIFIAFVTVTDLALVTHCENGRYAGFVLDAEKGTPVAGAQVELWAQERQSMKRKAKTVSAADGSFTIACEQRYGFLRAVHGKDEVISSNVWSGYPQTRDVQYEHLNLTTDRGIYRPGQTVKFKGIAFRSEPEKQDYRVLNDRRVFVTFSDPNGKEVKRLALMTNAYGSFAGEFATPRDRLTGGYRLEASLPAAGGGGKKIFESRWVNVEEYKRPKFTVKFDPVKEGKLGAETKVTGFATTYTGLPVAGAKVAWRVERSTCYPRWWYGVRVQETIADPVCAEGTATTDAKGAFEFTFTPQPPKTADLEGDPSFRFEINAVVTDDAGEAHEASDGFEAGVVPWRANVWAAQDNGWITPQKPAAFHLHLTTLNGVDVPSVKGLVKIYALKGPEKVVRKPVDEYSWRWAGNRNRKAPAEQVNLWDPTTWPNGVCVGEFPLVTDVKGEAVVASVQLPAGIYRAEYAVATPNGKTVKDLCTWRVIDPAAKTYAVKEPVYAELEKGRVDAGGTARLFWGSGYDGVYCRVTARQGKRVLDDKVLTQSAFCYELPITAAMVGEVAIEALFFRENRLASRRFGVSVKRPDSDLKITRAHFTSKLRPSTQETWSFTVSGTDTNDVRRGVEMLALLYDKSLDAFRPSNADLSFSRFFGQGTPYWNWTAHTRVDDLATLQGRWQNRFAGGETLRLRQWRGGVLGVFDWVDNGWRGAVRGNRYLARARVKKAAAVGRCWNTVEDEAPAVMCAAMPVDGAVREEEPAEAKAVGGRGATDESETKVEVAPRKNLAETAFFLPHLTSDEKGAVTFTFTVPEALTGWKFAALAHDTALRYGALYDDTVVTTKPLMVEPVAPRFAREGDKFLFPVKVTNTEAKPAQATAALALFDAASGKKLDLGAAKSVTCDLAANESKTVEFALAIPDGCGAIRYVAQAQGDGFADGEEGFLPVLSRRVEVREALPLQIKKVGTTKAVFKQLAASGKSETLRHAGLAVQVVSDPSWYAFLALPYLMEYPHECNEQTFSRFYANALGQHIAKARPAYRTVFEAWEQAGAKAVKSPLELNEDLKQIALDATPWINEAADETKAKRHIGELFGSARLEAEQARAVEKLEQNFRRGDDLWPWFPGGPGSAGVTMYILTGYARLDRLVTDPAVVRKPGVMKSARSGLDAWMVHNIDERLAWIKHYGGEFHLSTMDLHWLYLQSFTGAKSKHTDLLMKHLKKEWTDFSIAGQSLGALVLWRAGDKKLAREIVASLKERAVRSEEFGLYWKRATFFDCSLFAAPVSDQSLAMEAFLEITPQDRAAYEDARLWLLEQKRTQNWSTTVSTVDAVYAILLGDGKGEKKPAPEKEDIVTVKLGGTEVPRVGVEAATGFYEYRYDVAQIAPKLGEVEMTRAADKLGWVSLNWTYLEDVSKVKAFEQSGLRLTKTYFKKTLVEGRVRLVPLTAGAPLHPGDELVARLAIDSDRVYEYAHLRDERPAAAEPVDVLSHYRWQDGLGYYQSTRDTATHYYFDRLPKGNFVLETSFRVRQQGVFTSGLATLQCMYAPEFGAHAQATTIEVRIPQNNF